MNQIIFTNKQFKKINVKFVVQLIISILLLILIIIKATLNKKTDSNIIEVLNTKDYLVNLYNIDEKNKVVEENVYLCEIKIDKINLNYKVLNSYSEELLKILPCKFYGGNLNENTNICIAAHNYNNKQFFSRIGELEIGDEIYLKDLNTNKLYVYNIFDIYEIESDDLSILNQTVDYELTLLTCNNLNNKRVIVKSYLNNNYRFKIDMSHIN